MKRIKLLVLFFLIIICTYAQTNEIKVMTFNIRFDNPSDKEYSWTNRKEMVYTVLKDYRPEVIGFQEALKSQVDQIEEFMRGYKKAGVARDDGRESGEYSVILFDSARFSLQDGSTFWLSETPDVPGTKSWNAACNRIVTWVKLFDNKEKKTLYFFNTHFDHISEKARLNSARLILERISQIAGKGNVVLTGDFNSTDTSMSYKILTGISNSSAFNDTRKLAGKNAFGPSYSFVGFPFNPVHNEIIDFIFLSEGSDLKVLENRIIDFHINGRYPSDHLPVITLFTYESKK